MLATPRPLSASGGFNKVGVLSGKWFKQAMTPDDLAAMTAEFVQAARTAKEAGFDAVELHMGHGYLLSQFISKLYNKRGAPYGGSVQNRVRYPAEVLSRVVDAVGKDMAVICKISMTDGVKNGNSIADGVEVSKALEAAGAHLTVLSNGMNVESITAMFGSSFPKSNRVRPSNPIVALGMFIQQFTEPKDVQFSENYSLKYAREIRKAVKMPLAYLGGIVSAEGIAQVMSEGFDAIAMGRVLVHDPRFVNDVRDGRVTKSECTSCNRCVTMMYTAGGTSCVLKSPNDAALNTQHAGAAA
jgi:2,4-dienoyl-CoA reductase-like NADH-dependent reductase (Old Yellow Enzyme family)